jgi:flagellar basal body-associated protein FliL
LKKIITMVIIAALVLAAFSMLSTQSVKADTSEARVLSYSRYVAPSTTVIASEADDLIVVGEVENVGSNIIGNVTVEGIAFSSTGQELATTTTQAFVYDTLPGQKAPFYLDFTASSSTTQDLSWVPNVSSVSVTVSSVTDTVDRQYSGLTVPAEGGSAPYIPGNGTYIVVGTIVNTGNQAAQDPWVVATFYNSNGTVIGLNFTDYLTSSMSPGEPIRFYATPADDTSQLTSEIANYTLMVDSLTNSKSSQPTSSPTASTTTSTTPTSPTASTTTSTTQLPTLPIVVIVVVIVVVIAALMLLRKRQKAPPPPPPPPPPPTS